MQDVTLPRISDDFATDFARHNEPLQTTLTHISPLQPCFVQHFLAPLHPLTDKGNGCESRAVPLLYVLFLVRRSTLATVFALTKQKREGGDLDEKTSQNTCRESQRPPR